MRPAFSVILLTTLVGTGQGLFLALFTAQSYALFHLLPAVAGPYFYALGSLLAFVFLAAGLTASFFHLGRPGRAWRAASQWRTSWLSREVIVLPAFMAAVLVYGAGQWLGWQPELFSLRSGIGIDATLAVGLVATLLAFALFACTGMIYACLRFLPEWHSPLTVINYTLLGGASGFTLATLFAAKAAPALVAFYAAWAMIITFLALIGRVASLLRNARLAQKSSLQSAIGIKHPKIAQISRGFTGGAFNTREFFHGKSERTMRAVKWLFLAAAFVLPLGMLAPVLDGGPRQILPLVFVVQYAGMLAERWFFFAQAGHSQNLYYQASS